MQSHNAKLKAVFIFTLSALFFSGCASNVDLRQQAKEEKVQEQKSISLMQGAVDLEEENNQSPGNNLAEKKPVKILFVGDMMFDRHIREAVGKYGSGDYNYILEPLKEKLSEYDLVIGNLEGPITNNKSVSVNTKIGEGKNFVFTFDPVVAKVLAENNIKLVNLGNNHILNQGEKGLEQTKECLDEASVQYFEPGQIGSIRDISFISYNYSVNDSEEEAIEEIKSAKSQSDIVIVSPHWGTEYKTGDPGPAVRSLAHRFVDAGADAIIGTHPHVIQTSEVYNGKKIYYSLGNFIFDQYFQKETMEGLGVEVTIQPDFEMEYNEVKFKMTKKGQTIIKEQ